MMLDDGRDDDVGKDAAVEGASASSSSQAPEGVVSGSGTAEAEPRAPLGAPSGSGSAEAEGDSQSPAKTEKPQMYYDAPCRVHFLVGGDGSAARGDLVVEETQSRAQSDVGERSILRWVRGEINEIPYEPIEDLRYNSAGLLRAVRVSFYLASGPGGVPVGLRWSLSSRGSREGQGSSAIGFLRGAKVLRARSQV